MRFKTDENLPPEVPTLLRESGHDTLSVWDEQLRGKPDVDLARARAARGSRSSPRLISRDGLAFCQPVLLVRVATLTTGAIMEADDIYREVDARKKRASALRIREIVFNLYRKSFKHYPAWISELKDYVYPGVTEATELGNGRIQLVVNGHKYTFGYVERSFPVPDRTYTVGTLSMFLEEDLVLEFEVNVNYPENAWDETTRSVWEIKAFVDGPWVAELKELAPKVRAHENQASAEREKLAREDPAKLEDLKRRFGIS